MFELLMRAPAAICLLEGPSHRFELANHAYLQLVGRSSPDELVGKTVAEALPEIHGQGFLELLDRVYQSGEAFVGDELPVRLARAGDAGLEQRFVNLLYEPMHDEAGAVDGIMVHAVDVTPQVRARREVEDLARDLQQERDRLRESERQLAAVVEGTPECVKVMKPDGTLVRMNSSGLGMVEADSAEMVAGGCVYDIIAPEDRERFKAFNERVCAGESGQLEFDIIGLKGTRRNMESSAVPLRNPDGSVYQLAITRDVSSRRATQLELDRVTAESEKQRRLYETVLSSTPDLVYVFALDHTFSYANAALLAMWGKTAEEALGKCCLELGYEPWHAEMHDREIEEVVQTKRPIRGVVPFNGTNGRRMYDYIFVPVLGENGEVEAVAGTTRDVTERIAAEDAMREAAEAIRSANEELERKVAERTRDLQEAVQEAESFNYSISHDLRSPLRHMSATAHILLEDAGPELSEEHRAILERQARHANRLGQLIDELLRLSRLGRAALNRQPLDMTAHAKTIASELDGVCAIEIQEGMTAIGDPGLVHTVLQNLIGNACKFSPSDATVEVGQSGDTFWVRDHGIGFDMKYVEKIFRPFERLVTEGEFPGTGIGLANVERIVRRHGGRVWAESEPGKGATFSFTLHE